MPRRTDADANFMKPITCIERGLHVETLFPRTFGKNPNIKANTTVQRNYEIFIANVYLST